MISGILASSTEDSIVVNWYTDEPATSQVKYGVDGSYDTYTTLGTELTKEHSIVIENLLPDTLYNFKVKSMDEAGNKSMSGSQEIKTAIIEDEPTIDEELPNISILSPSKNGKYTFRNTNKVILVSGKAEDNVSILEISWVNSETQKSGIASGTEDWSFDTELISGPNNITVTAKDTAGNTSSKNIIITHKTPNSGSTGGSGRSHRPKKKTVETYPILMQEEASLATTSIEEQGDEEQVEQEVENLEEGVSSVDEASEIYGHNRHVELNRRSLRHYLSVTGRYALEEKQSKYAVAYFIHHGTESTKNLGMGERAGTLNSYLSTFGNLPESEEEWTEVLKIANGLGLETETSYSEKTKKTFVKIFNRGVNVEDDKDRNALDMIEYGIRPRVRNLNNERKAISDFMKNYRKLPRSGAEWNIVRALAYN